MKTDIIRFCFFNRKPVKSELYINEDGTLYKCYDPDWNEKYGWPTNPLKGDRIYTVIPTLEKTNLSIAEMVELSDFVWKNKIKDGTVINIKHSFEL